jgi:hypothetical protein
MLMRKTLFEAFSEIHFSYYDIPRTGTEGAENPTSE